MWEGGVHGSHHHEAAARLLPPWFGGPAAFGEPVGAAGGGGFGLGGSGGYSCDVVGQGGMFGFGFEAAVAAAQQQQQQQQQQQRATEAAAAGSSKAVVSGLLGSLQAELGRMNAAGEIMDAKALAASRSHSEAERRRRQRINGHLARLRSLLPNTTKTDKASLLAEVLEHVKELKRQTSAMTMMAAAVEDEEAGPAQMLPTEADELGVDAAEDGEGRLVVRASLCCEDRPDLIPDIIRALAALQLHAHRAEITTLGGRVRSVLLITQDEREDEDGDDLRNDECAASHRRHECIASVQEALRGVIDRRVACSNDTSSSGGGGGGGGSIKRQRMNYGAQEQCSV